MVTRFVVNYYILPIDVNAIARQNVVITSFCNVTTFWVATLKRLNRNLCKKMMRLLLIDINTLHFKMTLGIWHMCTLIQLKKYLSLCTYYLG